MIVLAASVLIAHLDGADAHHERATRLLIEGAGEALGASPSTIAEILVGPARSGRLDAAQAALAELEVATVGLVDDAPARLATLRATTGLRLPDCCVLLAAETADDEVATFDDRLRRAATDLGMAVRD